MYDSLNVSVLQYESISASSVSASYYETYEEENTYLVTGSLPSSGGALGKYMTIGNSGGFCVGKQPKKIGRAFAPVEIKSATLLGIGGNP